MANPESTTSTLVLLGDGMSLDLSTIVRPTGEPPVFLSARSGDVVIAWDALSLVGSESKDWWMGQLLWIEGGARDPMAACKAEA